MRYIENLPHTTRQEDHVRIPMPDGVHLSARVWRPVSSDDSPVPAILEYIPYRKGDLSSVRDSIHHPYIAGHGYACVRVDLRGTGDSEGVLTDEYLEVEQSDAEAVLDWLATQPWCDGTTGMMGISWGAFAALQVAARRPASLRAIVISSFTDDRYSDDMHYMGGAMLSDNLAEAGTMFAYATCPPDPSAVGGRWREMWHERLDAAQPWVLNWLRHQRRDSYWRHASVCEDYAAVRCPVLASSGWADGYSNAVTRLLAHLDVPRKGLIGPWSHKYPHLGEPGPAIGYLQEVVRWWDHWLKGADNGAMDGPMLRAWMQDSVPPSTSYEDRPGRWVGEPTWPSRHVHDTAYALRSRHLTAEDEAPDDGGSQTLRSPLSVGQFAGKWASYNAPPDLPYDQREEDGGSLVYETEPLTDRLEILGAPRVELEVSADQPVAMVAARLSDVAPDGSATRVTYGVLNLTRRDSMDEPAPLEPGRRHRATLHLNGVAQAFPPGHRVRLSLSTSYWPLAWPPPRPTLLTVHEQPCRLVLPVRPADEPDTSAPFDAPEGTAPITTTRVTPPEQRWEVSRDLVDYGAALNIVKDRGTVHFDAMDLDVGCRVHERYTSVADDFTSPAGDVTWTMSFRRKDWDVRVRTSTTLTCDAEEFHVNATLDAYEHGQRIASRTWNESVPRDAL
ncbi:putative CocE/NonD family hydrolase [Streptomyces phaeochromogenes]|jgi:putative CocE/NonD family hydrolase|uniref:CocE/NonD family hydrolase n=1 Tax=Streptomyces phaeochromogenes TaxID=1923 RepID=UPI00278CDF9E|nr:CocE/NonD family hydrolase [Streptomyces phaeochromogenes]MDQ0954379.1 putative CocE/NonD family hydrolase [Streptomyces phaeochromogenes]MDQ0955553.1 putative CocE/NonD family hydrolase [Streptomyces phaeochromogenes]